MEKLPMCRICLAENVRMYVVVNKNLHKLYERLTDIPFVTEDSRPILACFVCCAQLKKCYRLLKKCLEAEERFAQIMNKGNEPKPLINQSPVQFFHGFVNTPIESISIVAVCQTESIFVKEDLPAIYEGQDDIIKPKEEHQTDDDLETVSPSNNPLYIEHIPPHHSGSDSDDDVPLKELKTEVEEKQKVFENKRKAKKTNRAPVAKRPKLDTRRREEDDTITANPMKTDSKIIQSTHNGTFKPVTDTKPRVQNSVNNPAIDMDCRTKINRVVNCKIRHKKVTDINGEIFQCDLCQRSFNHKVTLISHLCTHTIDKPFKCDVCRSSFTLKDNLNDHICRHTADKSYKCHLCQRSYSVKVNLESHIRTHTGEKPYKCHVCQVSFGRKTSLAKHILTHTGEKPYKCDICQRSFNQNCILTKHIRIHTGEKPYNCGICQRSFTQKVTLTDHIRKHTGEKPYKCDICQRSFSIKVNLKSHIRTHTGEKPFKCDICQRSFTKKGGLTDHIRTHTGEKPYKCDICLRSFSQKFTLKTHLRIHTGEKPYKCNICQRSFRLNDILSRHIGTHTGEKPYKCDICQRGFTKKTALTNHIRKHTGEKHYKCDRKEQINQENKLFKFIKFKREENSC